MRRLTLLAFLGLFWTAALLVAGQSTEGTDEGEEEDERTSANGLVYANFKAQFASVRVQEGETPLIPASLTQVTEPQSQGLWASAYDAENNIYYTVVASSNETVAGGQSQMRPHIGFEVQALDASTGLVFRRTPVQHFIHCLVSRRKACFRGEWSGEREAEGMRGNGAGGPRPPISRACHNLSPPQLTNESTTGMGRLEQTPDRSLANVRGTHSCYGHDDD